MKSSAAAVSALALLALPARAQPATSFSLTQPSTYLSGSYAEIEGGSPFQGSLNVHASVPGVGSPSGTSPFRPGYLGGLIIGHSIAPGISVEGEGVYIFNHYGKPLSAALHPSDPVSVQTYGGLANARVSVPYNYNLGRFAFIPVGALGVGYGKIQNDVGTNVSRDGFLWQGKAGIEVKTGTPISFDFAYRYLQGPESERSTTYRSKGTINPATTDSRDHVQAATAGIKYTF